MGAAFSSSGSAPADTLSSLGFHSTAREAAKLLVTHIRGKTFVVTGAYSGIGAETAKALLAEGGTVILGGRNAQLQSAFVDELCKTYDASQVDGDCLLDLADLESVKRFAEYVAKKYDSVVLINNAGIMAAPLSFTKQGFESQMGVNVIGHFLLSKLLVDKTSRQVWVSSIGHKLFGGARIDLERVRRMKVDSKDYDRWQGYQQSKLGNILLAKEFSRRYSVEAASLHPGAIMATNLGRHMSLADGFRFVLQLPTIIKHTGGNPSKNQEEGASTTVVVAATPELVNGGYYEDCQLATESDHSKNVDDAAALFDYCDDVTKDYHSK